MKNCPHPTKRLSVVELHDSSPDGYGGTNSWSWFELHCTWCSNTAKLPSRGAVSASAYAQVTARPLDLEETKLIFANNHALYEYLDITQDRHDLVLRTLGKRTDALAKKIEAKKKLLRKHRAELERMLKDYHDGSVPVHEKASYLW